MILENYYNSLLKVKRIAAMSKRFIHNCRSSDNHKGLLSTNKLNQAKDILTKEA